MKTFLTYTFGAIALYIVVAYAPGFARSVGAASGAYNSGVKTLQGR